LRGGAKKDDTISATDYFNRQRIYYDSHFTLKPAKEITLLNHIGLLVVPTNEDENTGRHLF
jgi:hypothetical protein